MAEHPIIFSAPMVRAILEGRKTQTRRLVKPQPTRRTACGGLAWDGPENGLGTPAGPLGRLTLDNTDGLSAVLKYCPHGKPGDLLWVREGWQDARQDRCWCPQGSEACPCDDWMNGTGCRSRRGGIVYRASHDGHPVRWRSPIFMPREASRITLRIADVRVQRLQEISEADAEAEGFQGPSTARCIRGDSHPPPASCQFADLWDSINGKRAPWESNPWVWAITFERTKGGRG